MTANKYNMHYHSNSVSMHSTLNLMQLCQLLMRYKVTTFKIIDTIFIDRHFSKAYIYTSLKGAPIISECPPSNIVSSITNCSIYTPSDNAKGVLLSGDKSKIVINTKQLDTILLSGFSLFPIDTKCIQPLPYHEDHTMYKMIFNDSNIQINRLIYAESNWLERALNGFIYEQVLHNIIEQIRTALIPEHGSHPIKGVLYFNVTNGSVWIYDVAITMKPDTVRCATPYVTTHASKNTTFTHPIFNTSYNNYRNMNMVKSFILFDNSQANPPSIRSHVQNLSFTFHKSAIHHQRNSTIDTAKHMAAKRKYKKSGHCVTSSRPLQLVKKEIHIADPILIESMERPKTTNNLIEVHIPAVASQQDSFIYKSKKKERKTNKSHFNIQSPLRTTTVIPQRAMKPNQSHKRSTSCSFSGRRVYNNAWIPSSLPPNIYTSYLSMRKNSTKEKDPSEKQNLLPDKSNDAFNFKRVVKYANIHLNLYRRSDALKKRPQLLGRRAFLLIKGSSQSMACYP